MRGAAILAVLVVFIWLLSVIRMQCQDFNFEMCAYVCDRKGRELSSVESGFFTRCNCGAKKFIRKNMKKP